MSQASQRFKLDGLVAAPHTAMRGDEIDPGVIERQSASLYRSGVSGAFVCGSTGEGLSLTSSERMALAERWVEASRGKLTLIVHVGHTSAAEACALARHAMKIGASAVSALPPFYFQPADIRQLVDVCRPIADAAGDLPFYYYHIPGLTGVSLPMVPFLDLARREIPNLHGIKFTCPNLMEYQRCLVAAGDELDIAWGVDEMLLGALAVGAKTAVGSTYNFMAPPYLRMIEAVRAGDLATARQCSRKTVEIIAMLLEFGVLRTSKAIMSMIGIDCGPPRLPVAPLSAEETAQVRRRLEELGFFEDVNRV